MLEVETLASEMSNLTIWKPDPASSSVIATVTADTELSLVGRIKMILHENLVQESGKGFSHETKLN
jgi:hypothetical protein